MCVLEVGVGGAYYRERVNKNVSGSLFARSVHKYIFSNCEVFQMLVCVCVCVCERERERVLGECIFTHTYRKTDGERESQQNENI